MNTRNLLKVACFAVVPLVAYAAPADDRRIEDQVESSYNFRHALDKEVDVDVRDAVVTLTGKVRDESQKRIAEDTAAGIEGVSRVDNRIQVEGAREGSDDWLAMKVRARLAVKANVSMTNTDVQVHDGVVTLQGTAS